MDYTQLAEKVFYTVTFETENDETTETLELLTGEFNDNNYDEIVNALDNLDIEPGNIPERLLAGIKRDWEYPGIFEFPRQGLTVTFKREESEPGFSHSGCDICRDRLGTNVYSCIGYNDATAISKGQYVDIDVCSECLYTYHNGAD